MSRADPRSTSPRAGIARRPAFTLLEMLLALAVLVAAAAIASPAIFGPLENYRLRKSGELVRARWAKARNDAMKSGRTLVFRFQPGQRAFEVVPFQNDQDFIESSQLFQSAPMANQQPMAAQVGAAVKSEQLPEGTRFVGIEGLQSMRDLTTQAMVRTSTGPQTTLTESGAQPADGSISIPVLFYPDGSTSTIQVVLGNEQGYFILVKLRGLSGVAEVTDLLSAQELNQ